MTEEEEGRWWRKQGLGRPDPLGEKEVEEAEFVSPDRLYGFYVRGCETLEWKPLPVAEFWSKYRKRRRYEKFLNTTRSRMRRNLRERWRDAIAKLLEHINFEFSILEGIDAAIAAGRSTGNGWRDDFEDGGAGVGARLNPRLPVLVGAGAAAYPPQEPSRYWRED